jgi:hypothetical protein
MNFQSFVSVSLKMWRHAINKGETPVTLCVLGPPGIGKTAAGREIAAAMTAEVQGRNPNAQEAFCMALDLSSMLPEDLMGLPFRDGHVTRYCPQSWMAPICEPGVYGVLILDDLPAASGQVQVACRQASLERRIHEMKISPGVLIIVTGNRREDKAGATVLPSHFRNSVVQLRFSPDFEGWEAWYMEQGYDTDIPAFLHYKKEHFSRLPKDADIHGVFATPRTWSMLGKLSPAVGEDDFVEIACGLVGEGITSELAAFRLLRRELVDPEQVLADPRRALPDLGLLKSMDRMIAMATGLGEVAARRATGKNRADVLKKYLVALSYITSSQREYVSVSISTFTACKGQMKELLAAARKHNQDKDIKSLINYLAKTLER